LTECKQLEDSNFLGCYAVLLSKYSSQLVKGSHYLQLQGQEVKE